MEAKTNDRRYSSGSHLKSPQVLDASAAQGHSKRDLGSTELPLLRLLAGGTQLTLHDFDSSVEPLSSHHANSISAGCATT